MGQRIIINLESGEVLIEAGQLPPVGTGVTATAIAGTVTMPTPTVTPVPSSASVFPNEFAATVTMPTPTVTADKTVIAVAIAGGVTMPTPVVAGSAIITATAIAGTITMTAPAITTHAFISATAIAGTVNMPAPTVDAGEATVFPDPIAGTVTFGTITEINSHHYAWVIAATATIPTPSVSAYPGGTYDSNYVDIYAPTVHLTDHQELHKQVNNDFFDWGDEIGYVHPNGSDSYDGLNRRFCKATISSARSAGFQTIHVGAGSYTFPSFSSSVPYTFVFYPGTHTWSSTPTIGSAVSLVGYVPFPERRYNDEGGAAVITISGSPANTVIIDGAGAITGFVAKDLIMNPLAVTSACIKLVDVQNAEVKRCKFRANTTIAFGSSYGINAVSTGSDISLLVDDCGTPRNALLLADSGTNVGTYRITRNWAFGEAGAGGLPFIDVSGTSLYSYVASNSYETVSGSPVGADALIWFRGAFNEGTFIGNSSERTNAATPVARFDDAASSLFFWSRLSTGTSGELRVNGITYTGGYFTTDAQENRIIVADRYSNV